jgi:non-specific protein-tyrosine kinase
VILVDGDLRRPVLHEIFGVDNDAGLSDLVRQDGDLSVLPLKPSGVEGLRLLTSGQLPQNPSVLLGSKRMDEVIAVLDQEADIVLWDAPPVLAVTDAALLAARVDGTLLVVRAGGTRREQVQQARALLEQVNAHLVGAALTHASLDSSVSRYYQ